MTACRNKARGAVVAALAGALTLGAAPVMALAVDGAGLMATPGENFTGGELTIARDKNNAALDLDDLEFEVTGAGDKANVIVPVQVTLGDGNTVTNGLHVAYESWNDSDNDGVLDDNEKSSVTTTGSTTMQTSPAAAGSHYVAVVTADGYAGGKVYVPYRVVNHSLQGAYVYDYASRDVSDTTIVYDGTAKEFRVDYGIALDGKDLNNASQYYMNIFDAAGHKVNYNTGIKDAGEYTAVLKGAGVYEGSSVKISFTVEKFNLQAAVATLDTGSATAYTGSGIEPKLDSVKDLDSASVSSDLELVANDGVALDKGSYTYTLRVKDGATAAVKANYTGEGTVSLDVVGTPKAASDFTYDGKIFNQSNMGADATIDLSDEDHFVFDMDEVKVAGVDAEYVTVVVTNAETGEAGSLDSLGTPGEWNVTIKVDPEACRHDFGGSSDTVKFKVKAGDITGATMYVTYQGQTDISDVASYTGRDYLGDLTIQVKDANGAAVAESDYSVKIVKDGDEEVDSIVDAGEYTISLESDTYEVADSAKYTFTVNPVTLSEASIRVAGTFSEDQSFLPYTGEAQAPGYEWRSAGADGTYSTDDDEWVALPSDIYTVTYEQKLKEVELKEVGKYTAKVVVSDPAGNFAPVAVEEPVEVSDTKVFADVPNNEWYSEYVYKAASAGFGYINGYGDGTFFGPADSISRADVVKVLFNMAGKPGSDDKDEGSSDADKTFDLPYTDCDEGAYYAQALQWATKLGIVSGDGSNGGQTFRPTDTVTREELAKILYNYMALQGETEDVDADAVLGEYEDESSVSAWAREYVAWLVEQEVMGQDSGLRGDQPISRAEVATMAVRLQPNGALKDADFLK